MPERTRSKILNDCARFSGSSTARRIAAALKPGSVDAGRRHSRFFATYASMTYHFIGVYAGRTTRSRLDACYIRRFAAAMPLYARDDG